MSNTTLLTAKEFGGTITEGQYAGRSLPRCREMNDDPFDDFVSIDFETMTRFGTSACAIGMVKVIDAHIVDTFYSIINPVRDEFTDNEPNFNIHGIPLSECEKGLTFQELFDHIKNFIGPWRILCHNANADIRILNECMEVWGLNGIDTCEENVIDTYAITGKSLKKCCEEYKIELANHHNALCDAEAAARVYLHLINKPIINYASGNYFEDKRRKVASCHRGFLGKEDCISTSSIFNDKKIVITGTFDLYPLRDDFAALLQKMGGKVTSAISRRTDIVIVGKGAGPSKLKQIEELANQGKSLLVIYEDELINYLS